MDDYSDRFYAAAVDEMCRLRTALNEIIMQSSCLTALRIADKALKYKNGIARVYVGDLRPEVYGAELEVSELEASRQGAENEVG